MNFGSRVTMRINKQSLFYAALDEDEELLSQYLIRGRYEVHQLRLEKEFSQQWLIVVSTNVIIDCFTPFD